MGVPKKGNGHGSDTESRFRRELKRQKKRKKRNERERRKRDKKVSDKYGKVAHGSCGRKTRFRSEATVKRYTERHPTLKLAYYKCEYCGGWHLTSHPECAPIKHVDGGEPSLTVREVFEAAREAAIEIRKLEEQAQAKRDAIGVQGHGYESHSKSGILDPSRKILELIEWEQEQINSDELRLPIDEAYELLEGARHVSDSLSIEIALRYYLQGESWVEIAKSLEQRVESLIGLNRSSQIKVIVSAMDAEMGEWERIGIAHLREMGR